MDINTNPVKVSIVEGVKFHANSHPYKVEIEGGGDFATKDYVNEKIAESKEGAGKIVDELPDVGEFGVVYFVLKEETSQGDIYDEWMWLEKDGQPLWEHVGSTSSLDVEKTVSEADYDPVTNRLILWNLEAGVYKIVSNNSADYLAGTIHNGNGGNRNLRVGGILVVNEIGGASSTPLHKWILYPEWAASYGIASAVVDASGTLEGYSNGLLLGTSDVINNLTSTSSLKPLSANQGRLLNNNKQDKLTAGTGISIDANNVISTTYSVFTPNEWSALWS